MINRHSVFQRLIIYSVESYLGDISKGRTYRYEFMLKIRTAIRAYMTFHKFSQAEAKIITDLAKTEFMDKLSETEVDRTIYALELLVKYVQDIPKKQRAMLNISDKKIIDLKTAFIMDMLQLRGREPGEHTRVKEITDDSRINAKKYFDYCHQEIVEKK